MRRLILIAMLATGGVPVAAQQRPATYVSPYVEVSQAIAADLSNDDVVTFTGVAAGVDAGIATARSEGQISARYERRFGWGDNLGDDDIISGLARGSHRITRNLSIEGGAIATRARVDSRGPDPAPFAPDAANTTQLYAGYVGPTVAARAGVVDVNAAYRFGYTKVEAPDLVPLAPGQPRRDYVDSSTGHLAMASAGVAAGTVLPVGVTVSGAYEREDASQLDQRYEGAFARADVVAPVSRTVALRAGAGYEKIEVSQRDPLVTAGGAPVVDGNGRFVADPSSPRRIAYNTDGLIYDAGVIWRPNRRTEVQASAGYRYGGEYYTGSLSYRLRRDLALQVVVYDGIQTFGRQLRRGLEALPTNFQVVRDPFGQQFGGCVFGAQPGATEGAGGGAGGCLDAILNSVNAASYRARGLDALISVNRGPDAFGVGAGYANRRFFAPRDVPGITYFGVEDESFYAQAFWSHTLDANSGFDFNAYAAWSQSGLAGFGSGSGASFIGGDVFGTGMTGTYYRSFGRLGTLASLGIYATDQDGFESNIVAQALLGARYQF